MKRATIIRAADKPAPGLQKAALVQSGRMFSKKTEAVIFDVDTTVYEENWIRIPDGSQGDRARFHHRLQRPAISGTKAAIG